MTDQQRRLARLAMLGFGLVLFAVCAVTAVMSLAMVVTGLATGHGGMDGALVPLGLVLFLAGTMVGVMGLLAFAASEDFFA